MEVLTAPHVLLEDRLVADGWVAIDGTSITGVGTGRPPAPPTLALAHGVLAPGLIDAQLNGAYGVDLVAADHDAWDRVLHRLPETGVTAVTPTFISAPVVQLTAALRVAAARVGSATDHAPRARALGIHVEGPFLANDRRGAHDADVLCDPDPDSISELLDAGGAALSYVTLAPERAGALAAIEQLVTAGVRVAVGHTDATDVQVDRAVDRGVSLVTHLYNGQRPFHHRDPGIVGAALTDPRLTSGLIADLYHVAPTAVRLAFAAAPGRIMLVTDAIAALGTDTGTSVLNGRATVVPHDAPPELADGTMAGSTLRLDDAVGNAVRCGIAPEVALTAATRVPADALGHHELGRLAPGLPADLVWLGADWRTRGTWVAGQRVFTAPDAPDARPPG